MHLTSFGLISLKGSVTKPEPGLGFADYQVAMANYSASLSLRARVQQELQNFDQPDQSKAPTQQSASDDKQPAAAEKPLKSKPVTDGMSLVRTFRG